MGGKNWGFVLLYLVYYFNLMQKFCVWKISDCFIYYEFRTMESKLITQINSKHQKIMFDIEFHENELMRSILKILNYSKS